MILFFNDTATTEIYTLSLHDALPIYRLEHVRAAGAIELPVHVEEGSFRGLGGPWNDPSSTCTRSSIDPKSTRLNSSHAHISYGVLCLQQKKRTHHRTRLSTERRRQTT